MHNAEPRLPPPNHRREANHSRDIPLIQTAQGDSSNDFLLLVIGPLVDCDLQYPSELTNLLPKRFQKFNVFLSIVHRNHQ